MPILARYRTRPRLVAWAAATALLAAFVPARGLAQCSLTNFTNWCVHQDSSNVAGVAEDGDRFGAALTFGDFNGDGFDDLAVGVPGENNDAGFVHVFYSNGFTLTLAGQQLFSQDQTAGGDEGAENGDEFGAALVAGDFNLDGFEDLAVGSPGEDLPEDTSSACSFSVCQDTGGVHVIYGSPGGLQPAGADFFGGDDLFPAGVVDEGARFGAALAAGTFISLPGAHPRDLVIGAPLSGHTTGNPDRGRVYIVNGAPGGLNSANAPEEFLATDLGCDADSGEQFGSAVAVGLIQGPTQTFVAGAPGCTLGASSDAGAALTRLNGPFLARFAQSDYGAGTGANDEFGSAIAVGDFDFDGKDDLAIGAPGKNHGAGNPDDSGRVYVAYSGVDGPDPSAHDVFGEDEWADVGDVPAAGERFGSALAAGDVDGDGFDDLLSGAPGEGNFDVGRIYLKRGSGSGLTTVNHERFTESFLGGSNGDDDHLGNVIALGDIDGDGVMEIAMGVPDKDVNGHGDAGMVYVTRAFGRRLMIDGFESGDRAAWSGATP